MLKNQKRDLLSCIAGFNPNYRFKPVSETIVHSSSAKLADSKRNSIKVLSWNIAKNNYSASWSQEFSTIIEQYQPDKIFLQEVSLRTDDRETSNLPPMDWAFAPNFIDTLTNTYAGVLIATKYDRLDSQAMLTQHYEPMVGTPKVSLFTKYFLPNHAEDLLAVNAHLINFVGDRKFKAQLEQIESILAQHQGAIILAGDFNTWNSSRSTMLQQMAARLNLISVSFTDEDTKKIKNFLFSSPLDRIFYRGLRRKPDTAKVIDKINSSDHKPLFVELEIQAIAVYFSYVSNN